MFLYISVFLKKLILKHPKRLSAAVVKHKKNRCFLEGKQRSFFFRLYYPRQNHHFIKMLNLPNIQQYMQYTAPTMAPTYQRPMSHPRKAPTKAVRAISNAYDKRFSTPFWIAPQMKHTKIKPKIMFAIIIINFKCYYCKSVQVFT